MGVASERRAAEVSSFGDARSCSATRSLCRRDGRSVSASRDREVVLGGLRRKPRADETSTTRLSLAGQARRIEKSAARGAAARLAGTNRGA